MDRRGLGLAGLAAVVVGLLVAAGRRSTAQLPTRSPAPTAPTAPLPSEGPPSPLGVANEREASSAPEAFARTFEARIARLEHDCGLPMQTLCEGARCAAVVASPDLDRLTGWLSIVGTRPQLVVSTVLRDAGVDPDWLPCGQAIDELSTRPLWSVDDDRSRTGEEWWCTVDEAAPSLEARPAADLCNALVSRLRGDAFEGFSVQNPRELRFRSP